MRRVILVLALLLIAGCEARRTSTTASTPVPASSSAAPAATPAAATSAPSSSNQAASKPTAPETKDPVHLWQIAVIEKLQPFMKWPDDSPDGITKVSPVIRVKIDRQGRILGAVVEKSCGYPTFDTAARAIFKRAGTLPAPPPELAGDPYTFAMAITFTEHMRKEKE